MSIRELPSIDVRYASACRSVRVCDPQIYADRRLSGEESQKRAFGLLLLIRVSQRKSAAQKLPYGTSDIARLVTNRLKASKSLKSKTSTGEWLYLPGQERLTWIAP
jgi:hypothetical protein